MKRARCSRREVRLPETGGPERICNGLRFEKCIDVPCGASLDVFLRGGFWFRPDTTSVFSVSGLPKLYQGDDRCAKVKKTCYDLDDAAVICSNWRHLRQEGDASVIVVKTPRGTKSKFLPGGSYLCSIYVW